MKRIINLFLVLSVIVSMTSCQKIKRPDSYDAAQVIETQEIENNIAGLKLSGTSLLNSLKENTFEIEEDVITREEYLELISNPKAFTKIHIGDACGAMITKNNLLLVHSLYDLYYPTTEGLYDYIKQGLYKISYFKLPDFLSDDICLYDTSCRIEGIFEEESELGIQGDSASTSIILDRKNAVLLSFSVNKEQLRIDNAVKLTEDISSKDVRIGFGYKHNGKSISIFTDKYNNAVMLDSISFDGISNGSTVDFKSLNEWRIVGGNYKRVTDREYRKEGYENDLIFIYLYNPKENLLRKQSILTNKVIYERDLGETQIEGSIIKIISDGVGIYILVEENEKYALYYLNENREVWDNIFKVTKYSDGTEIENADDAWWFKFNDFLYFIAIFNKESEEPVKLANFFYAEEISFD